MSGTSSIVRRQSARKADMDRALKAAKDAGLVVSGIRVGADGGFEVLTTGASQPQRDDLGEWRARRRAGGQDARA